MRRIAVLAICFLLCACGTSAEPDYYNLAAVDGTPANNISFAIKVQRPSLAGYLDRPDIVSQDSEYKVRIDETRRWAQPLDVMVESILADDLRQRMPKSPVFTESDAQTGAARFVIEIDIQKFNSVPSGHVDLQGSLIIKDKTGVRPRKSQRIELSAEAGRSMEGLAAGMSELVGDLADQIVVDFQNMARPE